MITIHIEPRRLSDGSTVYNVTTGPLWLPAVTEYDALALASKISRAIEEHANAEARVVREEEAPA